MDFMEFYHKHKDFVRRCAVITAKQYGCGDISEDLVSAGMIVALEQLERYDEQQGATVTTFLHSHVIGAMRREVARHFGISRRQLDVLRKNATLTLLWGVSLDEPLDEDAALRYETIPASAISIEQQVYIKICLEHLQTAFNELSFREREVLGGFFGLYGHKKETLAEIGEAFQIKESAALKAKDKALERLRRVCLEGGLGYWMSIRTAIREAQQDCVVGRGDLGRWMEPEGCVGVE